MNTRVNFVTLNHIRLRLRIDSFHMNLYRVKILLSIKVLKKRHVVVEICSVRFLKATTKTPSPDSAHREQGPHRLWSRLLDLSIGLPLLQVLHVTKREPEYIFQQLYNEAISVDSTCDVRLLPDRRRRGPEVAGSGDENALTSPGSC